MMQLYFVTGNPYKFKSAELVLAPFGIVPVQKKLEIAEIQAEDPQLIVRDKANKAYQILQQPLVVSDDSWSIPGLNGFPGPYMSSINNWFTPQDFRRLTAHLTDRRIVLHQYLVYQDDTQQQIFSVDLPGMLVDKPRGKADGYSCATMISFDGGAHTMAEIREAGGSAIKDISNVWHDFGPWYSKHAPVATPPTLSKPDIHRLIELQSLLLNFQAIERVTHIPGNFRPENDTEHSFNLAISAWFIAQYFPGLNRDMVLRFALVHDLVEVHAGDTYIYGSAEHLATKKAREAKALKKLGADWPDFPDLIATIKAYETHASDEAKFVYALDKIMPIMVIFLGKGHTWQREGITPEQLHAVKQHKVAVSPEIAPYYDQLYELLLKHRHFFAKPR